MVILGIDPGWDRCGWAKIESNGVKNSLISSGLITTPREKTKAFRLQDLFKKTVRVYRESPKPDAIIVEEIHMPPTGFRISNLIGLGEARGVLLMAASQTKSEIREIHPLVVKRIITGNGKAHKQEVVRFLQSMMPNCFIKGTDDVTDAIAIALAGVLTEGSKKFVAVYSQRA